MSFGRDHYTEVNVGRVLGNQLMAPGERVLVDQTGRSWLATSADRYFAEEDNAHRDEPWMQANDEARLLRLLNVEVELPPSGPPAPEVPPMQYSAQGHLRELAEDRHVPDTDQDQRAS